MTSDNLAKIVSRDPALLGQSNRNIPFMAVSPVVIDWEYSPSATPSGCKSTARIDQCGVVQANRFHSSPSPASIRGVDHPSVCRYIFQDARIHDHELLTFDAATTRLSLVPSSCPNTSFEPATKPLPIPPTACFNIPKVGKATLSTTSRPIPGKASRSTMSYAG